MDYLLASELAGAVGYWCGWPRPPGGRPSATLAHLVWHAFCNGDKLRQTRGAIAAAAARHVDGKAAAHAAALLIVARENQRAALVNEMGARGTQTIYFCVAQVNKADEAATEAAAAWVRAADEAGFTLFEKKQIINTQAE